MTETLSNLTTKDDIYNLSDELNLYFQNKFCSKETKWQSDFTEDTCINSWELYYKESITVGAFHVLKKCYPQLNFAIEKEIDKTQDYVDVVLKGKDYINRNNDLQLNNSENIKITIHDSIVGKVPVIKIPNSQDFTSIIQCFLYKNNPTFVPLSMGALLANGINNWERIHSLKEKWLMNNPLGNWNQEFLKNILPTPNLYKDIIILLSKKPYSNLPAVMLGITENAWNTYSFSIRLEHECTHLYTLKKYGHASNNLHDELIADYIGISKTIGYYKKEWMLAFMGLEEYPKYRKGARLENYLGNIDIFSENFERLTTIIKNAIESIACFDSELGKINSDKDQMLRINALCETNILDIASENGANILLQKYNECE